VNTNIHKILGTQCTQLSSQLHTTTASTTRYVLGVLLNHHPPYTNKTCTHLAHHLHPPPHPDAPNNTNTTHLSSSRRNTYITTPTPNIPDLTDIRSRYQLNTTAYTYTQEIPTMYTINYCIQRHYGSHILRFFPLFLQCRTPYAVVHGLVLLMMGIMMPETCWDRSLIINIRLVASCWFLSLHATNIYYVSVKFSPPCFSRSHRLCSDINLSLCFGRLEP